MRDIDKRLRIVSRQMLCMNASTRVEHDVKARDGCGPFVSDPPRPTTMLYASPIASTSGVTAVRQRRARCQNVSDDGLSSGNLGAGYPRGRSIQKSLF